jgi:hypothetical protein
MEEAGQKSKRLSYTAKFKHEVVWCSEERCKAGMQCVVLMTRIEVLSFFQNPALEGEHNPYMILIHIRFFSPVKL